MTSLQILISALSAIPTTLVFANIGYAMKSKKNKSQIEKIPEFSQHDIESKTDEIMNKYEKFKLDSSLSYVTEKMTQSENQVNHLSKELEEVNSTYSSQRTSIIPAISTMTKELSSLRRNVDNLLQDRKQIAENYLTSLINSNPDLVKQFKIEKAIQEEKDRLAREEAHRLALIAKRKQEEEEEKRRIAREKKEKEEEEARRIARKRREEQDEEDRQRRRRDEASSYSSSSSSSSSSDSSSSWGSGDGGGFSGGGSSDSY